MRNGETPEVQRPIELSIITQFYPPDFAATGQLIEELATRLASYGLRVHVFTGQPSYAFDKQVAPQRENASGVHVQRTRSSNLWPQRIRGKVLNGLLFCVRSALHLLKAARRGDILLLTTAPPYLLVLGYFVNRLFGIPYVCLLYDLYPDIAVELGVVPQQNWLVQVWHWINRQVWSRAQGLIVLSSTMKDRITARYPELANKVSVIHSWSNPDWIVPIPKSRNWFADQYDLQGKFIVLYSGNMGRCHDMDTILKTVKELRDEPVKFVFIGGGAKRPGLMAQIEALGLTNCLFLPYQDKEVLPYSLTACDLSLVSVSEGMEGLIAPSKFYGSLAAGRPIAVICEIHSYLRHILREANCGQAFESNDSNNLANFIRDLMSRPERAAAMGRSGRSYLETHFTPDIIARKYLELFEKYTGFSDREGISTSNSISGTPTKVPKRFNLARQLFRL